MHILFQPWFIYIPHDLENAVYCNLSRPVFILHFTTTRWQLIQTLDEYPVIHRGRHILVIGLPQPLLIIDEEINAMICLYDHKTNPIVQRHFTSLRLSEAGLIISDQTNDYNNPCSHSQQKYMARIPMPVLHHPQVLSYNIESGVQWITNTAQI